MNFFENLGATIVASFAELFDKFMAFVPNFLAAIIILIIGLIVAGALGKLVARLVELSKIDTLLAKVEMVKKFNQSGADLTLSTVIGGLVKWFLILVTLIAVADILGLNSFNEFLVSIATYIPSVVVAVLILVAGVVLGNAVKSLITRVIKTSSLRVGAIVATIAQWSIVVFAVMAALTQLNIAVTLINTLFTGIVFMLALAGGLAFGLGGRDAAAGLISALKDEMKH